MQPFCILHLFFSLNVANVCNFFKRCFPNCYSSAIEGSFTKNPPRPHYLGDKTVLGANFAVSNLKT